MAPIKIKGSPIKQRSKGKDYWYAWRGGPRLLSPYGSQQFLQELSDAIAARYSPDSAKLSGMLAQYKASGEFMDLSQSTRDLWLPWLDKIQEHFGDLAVRQFDRLSIKPEIIRWHKARKSTPRAADTGLQVLSRLLSWGGEQGRLSTNQCDGIAYLYSADRADIIWTPHDLDRLMTRASPEIARAVRLAALTGLRRGDLLRLSWSHINFDKRYIELKTNKSRGKRSVLIALYDELRDLLETFPAHSTTVLTNSRKRPWTGDGFGSSWWKTLQDADMGDSGLHFHDLRGTAATNFFRAGFKNREIAETLGWSEKRVERLIDRYVKRDEIILDRVERMNALKRKGG